MSHPDLLPPIPSFGFSEASALLSASQLSEAVISPKKEKESSFKLRRRNPSINLESNARLSDPNRSSTPFVSAIVGTKEQMDTWLRESGPGSSCLWIHVEDFAFESGRKTLSGKLNLSYRLRSEQGLSLPLLGETLIELSPVTQREEFKRVTKKSIYEILHPEESDMLSLRSKSGVGNTKQGNSNDPRRKSARTTDRNQLINFVTSEKAYKHLLQMVSPGGVLREYQSLLRRTAESTSFIDVDFQLVDLQKWLLQHPFAIFWEDNDIVIVRREADNLKWTLLRFEFSAGLIRSSQGTSLCDLQSTFATKTIGSIYLSEKNWRGDQVAYDTMWKAREKELEDIKSKLEWKSWNNISSGQSCTSISPLNLVLIDILGSSATVSAAEIESVKLLFSSDPVGSFAQAQEEPKWPSVIQTTFTCPGRKRLTAKEKQALANLRSENKDVKTEGICTLLDLLLKKGDETVSTTCSEACTASRSPLSPSNPDSSRSSSSSVDWLHADQEDAEPVLKTEAKREEYGEGMEINSASDKFGEHKVRCNPPLKKDESTDEVGVTQLTEWVKCGFIHSLVEKLLVPHRSLQQQQSKTEKYLQFSFDRVVEACMKVMELLPREGTLGMVNIILGLLRELLETIGKLNCESRKVDEKSSSEISSSHSSFRFHVNSEPDSQENKLHNTFAKAVRFSKFLYGLLTRSSILSGILTISGGLHLILDFYSCLLKRFPINLRLGAQSIASDYCGDGVLPGEVLKSQVAPLRVLPCILPSVCICKVSQLCVMDCCIYPVGQKADLTWIARVGNSSSCLLKQSEKLADGTCNDLIERLLNLTSNSRCEVPADCVTACKRNQEPEFRECNSEEKMIGPRPDIVENMDSDNNQRQSTRPYVPRLPLGSMPGLKRNSAADVISEGFEEPNCASLVCMGESISNETGSRSPQFDILKALSDIKYELLRSITILFGTRSLSLTRIRGYLHQRLQDSKEDTELVLRFLPDMIGGFASTASEYNGQKMKKVLLQVVSVLDKSECWGSCSASDGINLHQQEDTNGGLRWSGPGPPPATSRNCMRAIDVLLIKIGVNLTALVNHLTTASTISEAYEKDAAISQQTWLAAGAERCCEPAMVTKIFCSGYVLSLWVDVGILLKCLGDFVLLWPEGGSARLMLNFCGETIARVLDFLTKSLIDQSGWNLAQILVMQNVLRLSTACMRSSAQEQGSTSSQSWNGTDEFFWHLFIFNDSNWTIVKNFADWVLQRSCQGCTKLLMKGYQRMLWEPLEIYHSTLGHKVYPPWAQKNNENFSPRREALRKSILAFLRTSVLLIKKKLKCQSEGSSQTTPVMNMSRLIFLLDFLMNPVDGLLMIVINAPVTSDEMKRLQKEDGGKDQGVPFNWNTKSDSQQPGIKETKNADVMGGLCTKCGTSETLTPSMRHECIAILADIFSLKAFHFEDDQTNLCLNPGAQNPFLFRKYVNPFLEIISLCFLKCYNAKSEHNEREQLQLLCFTSPSRPHKNNCILQRNEHVDSSTEGSLDGRNGFGACTTDGNTNQEAASAACIHYARILLTLAQNQTEDVSRSFQQVRIMEFLVQQIALEYEVSQIATPRESIQAVQAAGSSSLNTPLSGTAKLVKIQDLHHDHPEGKARKPVYISRRDEMRSSSKDLSTIIEGESIQREVSENMEADPRVEYNRVCISSNSQTVSRGSQTSRRSSDELTLNHTCCLKKSSHYLGFHSARDTGFVNSVKHQHHWLLLDQPLLQFHHNKVTCQLSEEVPKNLLPFGERNRNTLNPVLLSERGTTSTWTLSQRGRRVSAIFNGSLLGNKSENHNSPEFLAGNMTHAVQVKVSPEYSQTGEVQNTTPIHNQSIAAPPEDEKRNTISGVTEARYSGRFFDLNEEVERELAKENYSPASVDHITDRTESSSNDSDHLLVDSDNLQRELALGFSDMHGTSISGTSSSGQQLKAAFCSQRHDEDVGITENGVPLARPTIPRLKLPKSVRKGGQDVISDTRMNLEFLLSTTSTQESNGRLNSLLELQKEFACDRDDHDGSWMFGSYETKRLRRRLYRHAGLHVLLLELYIALMLNTQGSLEACYSDRFPMENRKINAPFFLSYHLNHPANSYLLPCLSKRMKDFKPAAYRILKLTWKTLFTPLLYRNRIRIAHGAFAQVYTATVRGQTLGADDHHVVLKVIDVPKGPHDPCKFFDVFSEVEILEKFADDPRVCQILDYGVEADSFVLVLKHYKCSLRTWRERQNSGSTNWDRRPQPIAGVKQHSFHKTLPLYLEVYSAVIQAVKVLAAENVVHYDLKCDNILLEPVDPSHPESEFWTPVWPPVDTSNPLPFRVCVADFGQSKASTYLGGECTVRNRGTEYVKSPEMLKLLSSKAQTQSSESNNLRQVEGAVGKAVDVWSLGCLLYELLTGEYLLYDDDWLRFFIRVTVPSEELIPQDKAAKLDNYGPVLDLLRFILVRDPLQRPTLDDVITCVEQLQLKIQQQSVPETSNSFSDSTMKGVMYAISDDEETGSDSTSSESDAESLGPLEVVDNSAQDEMPNQGESVSKFESEAAITQPDIVLEPAETWNERESVKETSDVFGPDLAIPKQGHAFSDCFVCLSCLFCGCLCGLE